MSEQSTDQTFPDQPPANQPPADQPTAKRAPVQSTSSSDADRFAAYDTRLQKFVGGVHDTKKAATDAAKGRGVKSADIDVRKV